MKKDIDYSKLPHTFNIPAKLAVSKDIDNDYKFLFGYIQYTARKHGYMWYRSIILAENLNKSVPAIDRGLKALKDAKWIKIENRVKKGKMYHADLRRAIWIYSDYLVAKDKGTGYIASRPLEFKLWHERLFNAIADNTKISQIMHFFPMMDYLGEMKVNIDPSRENPIYKYSKNPSGKFTVLQTSQKEQDEILALLYNFYKAQHHTKEEPQEALQLEAPEVKREIMENFAQFKYHIQKEYIDRSIVIRSDMSYTVNIMGYLMFDMGDTLDPIHLPGDEAMEMWQWLFNNQNEIKEIE